MNRLPHFVVFFAAVFLVAADKKPEKTKEPAPSPDRIQLWVKQLGEIDFKVRDEATKNLIQAGGVAFDAVAKATKSEDAEVKQRALKIIKHHEKEAIAFYKKLGGIFKVDEKSPGKPVIGLDLSETDITGAGLVHLKGLSTLRQLDLSGGLFSDSKINDSGLVHLEGLARLENLDLGATKISDDGLVHLKGLTKLQKLDLGSTKVTDAGLVHLKGLTTLKELYLWNTKVTGDGLVHLKRLTNLEKIELWGTKVTDASLVHLKELGKIQELGFYRTNVGDSGLVYLKGLTKLQKLNLSRTKVTDAGLEHLKGLTDLKTLRLSDTRVTDAGMIHLKGMKNLKTLNVSYTKIGDVGMAHLKSLTQLENLYLNNTKITSDGMINVKDMLKLKSLHVSNTSFGNSGLEEIKGLTNLESLRLSGTRISNEGMVHLKGLKKLRKFDLSDTSITPEGLKPLAPILGKIILKELGSDTSMSFQETPLSEAMEFLKDYHSINIFFDSKALKEASVDSDTPVTMDINKTSLRSGLKKLLSSIGLTFIVRHGVIIVTMAKVPKGKGSPEEIQLWIKQLGDESFKIREGATRNLIKAGRLSLYAVSKATKSNDPEVKQRALSIIKQINKEKKKAGAITPAGKAAAKTKAPDKKKVNVDPFADDPK